MKFAGLTRRFEPLAQKITGRAPVCPWRSVLEPLQPRMLNGIPPVQNVELVTSDGDRDLWRFDGKHEVWFPRGPESATALWQEYLTVFWDHPVNGHRYHRAGTLIEKGDVCIDCGACEGFFALQALDLGARLVVCLEPYKRMADCLRETLREPIASGRAVVVEAALSAVSGDARFAADEKDVFAGKLGDASSGAPSVRLVTLGQLCQELDLDRVDFVKMDIEGAELQAIDGAAPVLKQWHPKLAITTYHRPFDFAALRALLVSAGYRHIKPAGLTKFSAKTYRPIMLRAWEEQNRDKTAAASE